MSTNSPEPPWFGNIMIHRIIVLLVVTRMADLLLSYANITGANGSGFTWSVKFGWPEFTLELLLAVALLNLLSSGKTRTSTYGDRILLGVLPVSFLYFFGNFFGGSFAIYPSLFSLPRYLNISWAFWLGLLTHVLLFLLVFTRNRIQPFPTQYRFASETDRSVIWRRVLAGFVDLVCIDVSIVGVFVIFRLTGINFNFDGSPQLYVYVLFVSAFFLYFFLFEVTLGQTPGKALTNLRIVYAPGPPLWRLLIRSFGRCILLGLLPIFAGRPAWHERWSGTRVTRIDESIHQPSPIDDRPLDSMMID